jgi:hypothetical protein
MLTILQNSHLSLKPLSFYISIEYIEILTALENELVKNKLNLHRYILADWVKW